jgi:hypothetical protein
MHAYLKRVPLAGLALLVALGGCKDRQDRAETPAADSSRQGQAMIRVVNADAGSKSVDIMADDANAFTAVDFKSVTQYQAVNDNFVTFKVHPGGVAADSVTAENREMLSDGDRYILVVVPGDKAGDKPKLKVLEEPSDRGDSTKARVRVVNAARGVDEFDVYVPGQTDPFIDDVDFASEAGFKDLAPQTGALQIRANDGPRVLLDLPSRAWEAGQAYTIVVTNKSGSGNRQNTLEAIVVEDEAGDTPASY